MSERLHDTAYSWGRLIATLAIACVGNVGMWAVVVILPAMQAEFGIARGAAALPYTACMVGFAAGTFLVGRWVDRFGIVPCLLAGSLCTAVGFLGSAMSGNAGLVILLHLVIGFGASVFFGPLIADISHWFLARRGIAVAIAASGNYISGAFWPLVLAGVIAEDGWRTAYVILAAIVPAAILPLSMVLRRSLSDAARLTADAAASRRRSDTGLSIAAMTGLLCIAAFACCMAMSMPQVHIVALCVDLGFGPAAGAEMLSLMLLGGVVSRLLSGFLADRLGGVRTLLIGSIGQCLALFLYLPAGELNQLYMVSLVFGLAQGGIVPAYAIIVREYLPSAVAGARVGLVTSCTIAGMAMGGWVTGLIYDLSGSYDAAFLSGIGWNMLNIAIVGMILFTSRPRRVMG